MPKIRLTDLALKKLATPECGQTTYWDHTLSGFGVRVSQGGSKTFVAMFGHDRRRVTLGRYPVVSLAEARKEARRRIAEHTLGRTPTTNTSFADARARFLEAAARRNRPRTVYDYRRLLNRHFKFGTTPLAAVTAADIARRIDRLKKTPSEANHAFTAARAFFNWAYRNHYIETNPIARMTMPAGSSSRDRVLSDDELAAVYKTAIAYPYPFGHIVQLLILTGQRRGEIAALQWDWIEDGSIHFPATIAKNNRAHVLPLGHVASTLVENLPEMHEEYVFPASRSHVRGKPTTIFNGWQKGKAMFDKICPAVDWTLHDLRRTFATNLAALGTPIHVSEKLLNHISGSVSGVAAVYNRHSYMDEMREALAAWEAKLAILLKDCG